MKQKFNVREYQKSYQKKYRKAHRKEEAVRAADWRKNNPKECLESQGRYRAKNQCALAIYAYLMILQKEGT